MSSIQLFLIQALKMNMTWLTDTHRHTAECYIQVLDSNHAGPGTKEYISIFSAHPSFTLRYLNTASYILLSASLPLTCENIF